MLVDGGCRERSDLGGASLEHRHSESVPVSISEPPSLKHIMESRGQVVRGPESKIGERKCVWKDAW